MPKSIFQIPKKSECFLVTFYQVDMKKKFLNNFSNTHIYCLLNDKNALKDLVYKKPFGFRVVHHLNYSCYFSQRNPRNFKG